MLSGEESEKSAKEKEEKENTHTNTFCQTKLENY